MAKSDIQIPNFWQFPHTAVLLPEMAAYLLSIRSHDPQNHSLLDTDMFKNFKKKNAKGQCEVQLCASLPGGNSMP